MQANDYSTGYTDTGSTSGSWYSSIVSSVIGAWSARELEQEKTKQVQAKEMATPYQYNNPQAMVTQPANNTTTYLVVGAVALLAVVGIAVALK